MFRTVLLLFCMSAAIYGALSCPSSKKKSEPDATPETKEDPPKDRSDWPSENQFHPGGCYRIHGIGPRAELKKMSPRICALECAGKSPKKSQSFGLAYGDTCLCESELESRMLPTELDPEVHCSHRCPGNHRQSCGGDMAVAYFNLSAVLSSTKKDKFEQGAKFYPVIPESRPIRCQSKEYIQANVPIVLAKGRRMSHLVCATECVRRDFYEKFKYFGIDSGNKCYCASKLPTAHMAIKIEKCSSRCPGNHRQSCGYKGAISYFNLRTTLSSPKPDKYEQGATVTPDNFRLAGCFYDESHKDTTSMYPRKPMSYKVCAQACIDYDLYDKYKYITIKDAKKCHCSSGLPAKQHKINDTDCKQSCQGKLCMGYNWQAYFEFTRRKPYN